MSAGSNTIVYRREMSITHAEFFRVLPTVTGSRSVSIEGDKLRVIEGKQAILIGLSEVRAREIGALCLPVTDIELRFSGYTYTEARRFMARFDLHFRRGGG